ncbi:hypothetical protein L1887_24559 [Cichorium endivia]|nr:hypothetical protein L1887_24559 [Cichorium endivia]
MKSKGRQTVVLRQVGGAPKRRGLDAGNMIQPVEVESSPTPLLGAVHAGYHSQPTSPLLGFSNQMALLTEKMMGMVIENGKMRSAIGDMMMRSTLLDGPGQSPE